MHCVCILGSDTEIGKTYVTAKLAGELVRAGRRVGVYKPAASGVPLGSGESDADILAAAAQVELPIERVCPQCFAAPLAPPVAANLEGRVVDEPQLVSGAVWWQEHCQLLLVEGAGGVLSPISQRWTCLDLAVELSRVIESFHVLLVTEHRLGMVNQALMALEAIERRKLPLLGTFINHRPCTLSVSSTSEVSSIDSGPPSLASNIELLQSFSGSPLFLNIEQLVKSIDGAIGHVWGTAMDRAIGG